MRRGDDSRMLRREAAMSSLYSLDRRMRLLDFFSKSFVYEVSWRLTIRKYNGMFDFSRSLFEPDSKCFQIIHKTGDCLFFNLCFVSLIKPLHK